MAAPQVISATAAQLLSLSAKTGLPSAGPKTSRTFTPAQPGRIEARITVPSGRSGPETETPTPSRPAGARPLAA